MNKFRVYFSGARITLSILISGLLIAVLTGCLFDDRSKIGQLEQDGLSRLNEKYCKFSPEDRKTTTEDIKIKVQNWKSVCEK